ncbi:Pyridine nucleotide-disulfide oxidoreductase domain-containing protein 2-like [Homarus americanus]|uniref:Pyridine nucleotide-disulfide oxidoreductase domain-containing protein 2-like n=1 Tax=Homarus americanus TaxID=6706 RepID=A0A8J5JYT9_HOMAM|nr:Pyridine nucleotide-disulfide oxidoreductase domain-containing protein 2-like [Homarus americanus]
MARWVTVSKLLHHINGQTRRCHSSVLTSGRKYDAIIVGGGHNGLVAAFYLAKAGKSVCVLERRHILGGAAVTEEIIPGFKFSRASYVLGLLRPKVYDDLELKRRGLKVYPRDPSSYTPLHERNWQSGYGKSLILGPHEDQNYQQIAQFSKKDAEMMPQLESLLGRFAEALDHLLDCPPPDIKKFFSTGLAGKAKQLSTVGPLVKAASILGKDFPQFYELMTAPTTKILDRWLESEPLKATLATDSVIGAMMSPNTPGSGYVLLHHVMAQMSGVRGAWGYPEGGMGAVTQFMAQAASETGAHLFTNQACSLVSPVKIILLGDKNEAVGVETEDGSRLYAKTVLSNATADTTFLKLLPAVAVKSLPDFKANPNNRKDTVMPHHRCTIHLNCEKTQLLEEAFRQASAGLIPDNPMIEMTLPSSCDPTLAPPGCHVALFFTQYVPYTRADGRSWNEETKTEYGNKIFNIVEEYAPGFKESIIGYEVLPPPELERVFGLTGGNIFHGSMSLDQLFISRPSPTQPSPFTPIDGLLLCGSGAHPGGGVMGAPGRLAALSS